MEDGIRTSIIHGSEDDRRAPHDELDTSVRAELLFQLLGAQTALGSHVEELRRSGDADLVEAAEMQLAELRCVQERLASGSIGVSVLRREVASSIAAATAITTHTRAFASSQAQRADDVARTAHEAARQNVAAFADDFYERRIFDPYLRFASADEEAAYRRRESERQLAMATALAANTPEGTLQANRLAIAQLHDAGAFGADASPEYASRLAGLKATANALSTQVERQPDTPITSRTPAPTPMDIDRIGPASTVDAALLEQIRTAGIVAGEPTQDRPAPIGRLASSGPVGRGA